jgi:hypothetical protein
MRIGSIDRINDSVMINFYGGKAKFLSGFSKKFDRMRY